MLLKFTTVDVFTDRQFGGNPLAVVHEAEGLTGDQMQAIAAEFNLSETTFILPPKDEANTAEVRIFTPRMELPFAGHPNVGTAFVLARLGESYGRVIEGDQLAFEEKAGLVRIDLLKDGADVRGARLAAPQALSIGDEVPIDAVAAACGLSPDDIETANHRPCTISCGVMFTCAEVRSRAALAGAAPNPEIFTSRLADVAATGIHLYCQVNDDGADIEARMFAPLQGIMEDPATGSANVTLIGLLAHLDPAPNLELTLAISQGVDMGRPSLMTATAEKKGGSVTGTWIGGNCVHVMTGEITLEPRR